MSYLQDGIRYPKPLSLETQLLIETVCHRYGGIAAPFMAFDRGDHVELRCPTDIRRVTPYANKITASQTDSLRISNGEGASNGNCS